MIKQFYFEQFNLNVKEFYLTHRQGPIRCYHSRSEWTWECWQWRGTPQSFSITGTSPSDCLVSYLGHSMQGAVGVFYSPSRLGDIPHWSKGKWIVRTCACRHPRPGRQISANWCCIMKRMCIVHTSNDYIKTFTSCFLVWKVHSPFTFWTCVQLAYYKNPMTRKRQQQWQIIKQFYFEQFHLA